MEGKFLGLGLTNIVLLWIMFIALTLIVKTVVLNYNIPGLTEIFAAL